MLRWMAIGLPLILGNMAGAQTNDSAFIARLADEAGIEAPATLVVGDVVTHAATAQGSVVDLASFG